MNTEILLHNSQINMAAGVGVVRQIQYLQRHKNNNTSGSTLSWMPYEQGWGTMIEGALSEYALAKYLNRHWEGAGAVGGGDVGYEEVRVTNIENGSLVIRKKDKKNRRYWLLTGINGKYTVRGFIVYQDELPDKYLDNKNHDKPEAWFIPQSDLIPPDKFHEYEKNLTTANAIDD